MDDPYEGRCRWCGVALPEESHLNRRYCCHAHRQRAYERRWGLATGSTKTTKRR